MIKYIVQTTSSYNDYYGNTYHFARITSTKTGKSLVVEGVGGSDNAAHLLVRRNADSKPLVNDWSEIYRVQTWEKKREWQRLLSHSVGSHYIVDKSDRGRVYEGDVTATMIRRLNRKAK